MQTAIDLLIAKGSFREDGKFTTLGGIEGAEIIALDNLVDMGVVSACATASGEVAYAVVRSSLQARAIFRASEPRLDLLLPLRDALLGDLCKLELIQALLAKEWEAAPGGMLFVSYGPMYPKIFSHQWPTKSKAYLMALLRSEWIFSKPGDLSEIYHTLTESYYVALLTMEDLTSILMLGDISNCTEREFKSLLGGASRALANSVGLGVSEGPSAHKPRALALMDIAPAPLEIMAQVGSSHFCRNSAVGSSQS